MLAIKPTKNLRENGILDVEIQRGKYGFTPYNPKFRRQRSVCFKTALEAVQEVILGFRPEEVKEA